MADYSIHFHVLVANSGWNDTALLGCYIQGLGGESKRLTISRDEMPDLEALIALTIQLDNRLKERQRERVRVSHAVSPTILAR